MASCLPGLSAFPPPGAAASAFRRSLLLDRRREQAWWQRLPGRLSTSALWLGALTLIGPLKLTGVLLVGSLLGPGLLLLDRQQRSRAPLMITPTTLAGMPPQELPRATVAEEIGVAESQLFRARHAAICTIHHDSEGRISAIAMQDSPLHVPLPRRHAHPVG